MNIITISNIRTYLDEKQTVWLSLEDVSRGLGFTTVANSGNECVRWNRVNEYLKDLKYSQEVGKDTFIPENIFYRLAMKANNEVAEKFQEKIANEVLPDIRKHGLYLTENLLEKTINNPDFMIDLLKQYKQEREEKKQLESKVNMLIHTQKLYTSTEIAKELGFKSATALNEDLKKKGIQYKINDTWVLTSDYADKKYTSVKQDVLENGKVIYDRKWTGLGREFLLNLFNEVGKNGNS